MSNKVTGTKIMVVCINIKYAFINTYLVRVEMYNFWLKS